MDQQQSLLQFPCEFPIKIMGPAGFDFEAKIISMVRKHAPDLGEAAITTRLSKDGTYQAITVTIHAMSKEQLDAIYKDLNADKEVLMTL